MPDLVRSASAPAKFAPQHLQHWLRRQSEIAHRLSRRGGHLIPSILQSSGVERPDRTSFGGLMFEKIARSFTIAFTMRSGSNAICDLLTRNGLGCPSEWFQKPPVTISGAAKFDTFARFVDEHQAEGIFGSKMSYDHRAAIDLYLRETVPGYCRLDDVLPGHRWVRLVRKDKILRAISLCRAECSGEWALKEDEHRKCPGFEYDFFHVLSRVMAILTGELAWDLYFQQHGITPCVIAYEDFFDDLEHQLPPLIDYLGGLPPGHTLLQQSTQFRIQRNALNYRLRERFVFDLSRVYDPSLAEEVGAPWHMWKHFHSELQWRSQRHRAA